jgi:7-cyano-7-deazaguanine synthase in queuosine biosynthesis
MKGILLNSGGIDSRVAAAIARNTLELVSLYIDCNPHNRSRALPAAEKTASLYCTEHVVIPFPMDIVLLGDKRPSSGLPGGIGYSSLFCTVIAASYAKWRGDIDCIVAGTKKDAWAADWKEKLAELLACYKFHQAPMFFSPVEDLLTVHDVVAKATELGVPIDDTASCGADVPCGVCGKCKERKELGLPIL